MIFFESQVSNLKSLLSSFRFGFLAFLLAPIAIVQFAFAADFPKDLSVSIGDVKAPESLIVGQAGKIYVTIRNNSKFDLAGVVKFFDEKTGKFVGSDQPISAIAGKTDDVFIEWSSDVPGDHPFAIRIVPWDEKGDNPDNNKVVKSVFVDIDTDRDGIGNRSDPDDDNDGIPDSVDAFPLNPKESKDTDHDGIGDNADPDDDNDGVPDIQDAFPTDASETKDSDGDGVGDDKDAFPLNPKETLDSDQDGLGDNDDPNDQNKGPIPNIEIIQPKAMVGETMTFNAVRSSDPDDYIKIYEWDFDDGLKANGPLVDHAFQKPGLYIVTLRVTDSRGEYREAEAQVTVKKSPIPLLLVVTTSLLALLILGMLIPSSRFYYKKMTRKPKGAKKDPK
jgi:hypothetical protein